ncbi:MAG: c-type cytochrome [bacterium]|nr:c-type cytochrome [bacterium]
MLLAFVALVPASDAQERQSLQVLFLGDGGPHQPAARAQQVLAEMRSRGIDLHYEEDLGVLEPARLARFDAVLLYANHGAITAAQEEALLGFVEGGGGFVPVHCASYCFLNSPRFVALVGAQFQSHGTGVFTTERVAPEHPVLRGLPALESWDETYVHHEHAADRTILARRDDEPWTWVRKQGRGRVFYTAWGHDHRTWGNAAFHDLLERGIRWSVADEALAAPRPESPFEMTEAKGRIPNYRPGGHGEPFRRVPAPLAPDASRVRMVAPPGMRVELFAAEPDVRKPIAMAWDERGRLWVAETIDYPNEREDGAGHDRIQIVEDTDGDGRADRFTVFADGLSIPTSLTFSGGGVVVAQAPDTLFLRDTDGDDRADERTVLFSGWGTGDTHAGPSHLRYGLDNWIWGSVGYAGFRGVVGDVERRFGQGFYRFRPDGSELEFLASTTNNTWGLAFSEEGFVFGSTANGNPSVHMAIPNRYYEPLGGWSPGALQTIAETLDFHPITTGVRQVDYHGKFTAAAGHALYTARAFPREYWNRVAFVNAPTGHLVQRFLLEPDGTHFVARDGWNLVASDDEWTAPIAAEIGPDGAVWFIDWYAYIVQHNPTPPGFENGRGNAYVTPMRDKVHGRIYRVVPENAQLTRPRDLSRAPQTELVQTLGADNLFWRLTAQRLLIERGGPGAVAALLPLVGDEQTDALGLAPRALHALYCLAGLGALDDPTPEVEDALVASLRHVSPSVRRAALMLLPPQEWALDVVLSARMLEDEQPHVRLAALLALSQMPASEAAGRAVLAVLERPENLRDRWIPDAATAAAARHDAGFLKAILVSQRITQRPGERKKSTNVLENSGMEGAGMRPQGWAERHYSGKATHTRSEAGRTGHALRIDSSEGADTSWHQSVGVEPGATYRLSGWIRTEGLEPGSGLGALLNVHEIQGAQNARTQPVDSTEWTRVEVVFDVGGRERVSINCLFGGWGQSRGAAFFDDVTLERVDHPLLAGPLGRVASRVAAHYAGRGPSESIVSTVSALSDVPPDFAELFLDGIVRGWPEGVAPELTGADRAALARVLAQLEDGTRAQLVQLADRWGQRDVFASEVGDVLAGLRESVASPELGAAARVAAAERLVRLDDGARAVRTILAQLDVATEPELASGLLSALSANRAPATGDALLARWEALSPTTQRAAVRLLLLREPWTRALLEAVEVGAIPPSLVDPAQWAQLEQYPEPGVQALAARARGRSASADGAALVTRFHAATSAAGDAQRGRALFAEHCAKCHVFDGSGSRVGPELDGIGERPTEELLVAILDPNRSVEANYQLWTVRTKDGLVYGGRLVAETRTAVEILEESAESRVLDRVDIEVIVPSKTSLMPAGFESLGEQGLADLLQYLRSPR